MRLRDHPDELAVLVARAAAEHRLPVPYVEKDFWVTEVLRAACPPRDMSLPDGSTSPVTFIFKGGTSLSRVFGIIDRFSEDVDLLAVFPPQTTANARHRVLKQVDADVAAHLGLAITDVIVGSSRTGVKRHTTYRYPTGEGAEVIKEGVLLELGSRGGSHPHSRHLLRSIVADFAVTVLGEDDDGMDEFTPFLVDVLAPERTLLEKVAAVHAAAARQDTAALLKQGRHFYDIDRLLNTTSVTAALSALGRDGLSALVTDIDRQSEEAGFAWAPRPSGGYADSPAFDPAHGSQAAIRRGYQNAMTLIHGQPIDLAAIYATVSRHRNLL